jgi:hypothetical protein
MANGLTKKQRQAVELLSQNMTFAEVMSKLGIPRRTFFSWQKKEAFKGELQKAKETRLGLNAVTIEKLGPQALAALNAGLIKGDPRIVLYVAEKLRVLEGAQTAQKRFKISFGTIPVDTPKPALKIVEMPKPKNAAAN